MNNVIFILVDSVFSDCLGTNKTQTSSTPFIDSIQNESFFADNIYSYAPYTDAATIGLYCGVPALETLGYYFGINVTEYNHFRLFHDNGFETYGLYYPYYLVSNKTKKDVDHVIYTGGFKYSSVWGGKFEYYAKLREKRPLTELEYSLMEKCLDMTFGCWLSFYDDIEKDPDSSRIVSELHTDEFNAGGKTALLSEYDKYILAKRQYIDGILDLGMNHPLASVNDYDLGKKRDKEFYARIFSENKRFFKKLEWVNFKKNLLHNHLKFGKSIGSLMGFLGIGDRSRARYIENYGMLILANQMLKKRALNSSRWQDFSSLNKQIEAMFDSLEGRSDDKPFYASLHVLEPHHNISYFSFDSFDDAMIREELEYLSPLLDGCGRKFSGNLLYQLSLRYVDLCIKRLFDKLKAKGLDGNTTVVLVADHGTSYYFDPVRTRVVNTFHRENYNVPLLIWQKDMPEKMKKHFTGRFSSGDILPTLCGVTGISAPAQFEGKIIYEEPAGRDYVITEYMGPGVPDMLTREVWISIRNDDYVVAYKNDIREPLSADTPCVIYDLRKDPKELNNCVGKINVSENKTIAEMVELLKQRYDTIRQNTKVLMDRLDEIEL